MLRTFLLLLEYDGTDFAGFQRQAARPTIQAAVEDALGRLTRQAVRLWAAGRTDTGVHARAMPVTFRAVWPGSLDRLVKGLNHFLPESIAGQRAWIVPDTFDPRRQAVSRAYQYTVLTRSTPAPLQDRFAYRVPGPLDVPAMAEAAAGLIGTHDFASFADTLARGSSVRELTEVSVTQREERITLDFVGNAFVTHQIRNTVGTLIWVGQGRLTPADFHGIVAARDRRAAGPAAPARGLCLTRVEYGSAVAEFRGDYEDAHHPAGSN